jgi:thiol-disulfide isomerase/thioredoxin
MFQAEAPPESRSTVVGLQREGIRIRSVNVRTYKNLAKKHRIRTLPTYIYFEKGEEVRRRTGWQTRNSLIRMCRGGWFGF